MAKKLAALPKPVMPLRSEGDYELALAEIETYFAGEPKPDTPAADRFDLLALVIEDYERRLWPVGLPDALSAIRYRMETGGYSQADLGRLVGSRQRASDILTGKRPITMAMAWKLYNDWKIPAEVLISPLGSR